MKRTKKIVGIFLILTILFPLMVQISVLNLKDNPIIKKDLEKLQNSGEIINTKQWIKNSNFSTQQYWYPSIVGDNSDVNAEISGGKANFEVVGDKRVFSLVADPPLATDWTATENPAFPFFPDTYTINNKGCEVYHHWSEGADQSPSVHWDQNITMPVNMSDYIITSASLKAVVNGTVKADNGDSEGVEAVGDAVEGGTQYATYDYARFYVLISDLDKNKVYEVAYNQTVTLGKDSAGDLDYMYDTFMFVVPEESLIFFLNSVLKTDYFNFTITLGIRIWCEDNWVSDDDFWESLIINYINLTFNYEKKIDQLTSVSWNQDTEKPNDITTNPIVVDEALLDFEYMINETWTSSSPNSEIRMYINTIQHTETVKLSTASTSFQKAKQGGFDVTPLIQEDKMINLSIQVYLADEFALSRSFNISIDNVYLNVTYTEIVPDIPTKTQLFLDGKDKTNDPVLKIALGEKLNITLKYTNETGDYIPGALVQLEGKVNGIFDPDPSFEQYNYTVNTNDLGIGVSILTITAQKTLYETNQTQIFVEVTERETEMLLFLNGNPKNDGDTITVQVDQTVNITVYFRDNETHEHLPDASVVLLGWNQLNETNNQYYNITINTSELDRGINPFTIFAQLINYTTNSINFFIEVVETATKYQLFLNNIDSTLNPLINLTIFETLNITVKYLVEDTGDHIINATLQYIGEGLSGNLTEYRTQENYSKNIDTTDLGIGVTIINIIAQKDFYETQNIQIYIQINERKTNLQLFLNNNPKNDGDKIEVELNNIINITLHYKDKLTGDHLINATVDLLGWYKLNETSNHYYYILINANDLDQRINILTIFAQKENYEPLSIQFFVEVTERSTQIQLFLNGLPKTTDPVLNLQIGEFLNITVKYTDNQTGLHIPNALVQLLEKGVPTNLTKDDILGQHYLILDTEDFGIGTKLFTIIAQGVNYQIRTIESIRINIIPINTIISRKIGGSQIEAEVGDDILLEIKYTDLLNNTISNATVTYTWSYGQENLLDPDNNGIYEATLENVREGIHIITISAFAGDNYEFKSYEITLVVTTPTVRPGPDWTWLVYTLIGGIAGLITIFTLYQTHFKYPPMVRKIRSLKKKFRKNKRVKKPLIVQKREKIVETSYKTPINDLEIKTIVKMSEPIQQKSPKILLEEIPEPKKESTFDKINKLDKEEGG